MAGAIPSELFITCPRCKTTRMFVDVSGGGTLYRCGGCEWTFTLGTVAPTGTSNAAVSVGGTTISVASGGASFTNGMFLLYDTGSLTEVLVVNGSASGTSIPVAGQWAGETRAGFAKAHSSAATFGQLSLSSTQGAVGEEAVPAAPGWGF
jgi:hypothetical protein